MAQHGTGINASGPKSPFPFGCGSHQPFLLSLPPLPLTNPVLMPNVMTSHLRARSYLPTFVLLSRSSAESPAVSVPSHTPLQPLWTFCASSRVRSSSGPPRSPSGPSHQTSSLSVYVFINNHCPPVALTVLCPMLFLFLDLVIFPSD